MTTTRSNDARVRKKQKHVDVKVARAWFQQMIREVEGAGWQHPHYALKDLAIRVREWRP